MASVTPFRLHLLNVGQGEAILFDFPDGSFRLLDSGPHKDGRGVLELVKARCAAGRVFRFAAASQWDRDHIAGFSAILNHCMPEEFAIPGVDIQILEALCAAKEGKANSNVASLLKKQISGLHQQQLTAGLEFYRHDGIQIWVLSPSAVTAVDIEKKFSPTLSDDELRQFSNKTSVAFWIRAYGRTLFLAGEAEADQYLAMDQQFRRNHKPLFEFRGAHAADWIKLSHHGSQHNNVDSLYQFFAKDQFVASASAGGRYGHPHPLALRLMHETHGGHAMCTRLGQGCDVIIDKGLDKMKTTEWLNNNDILSVPNPNKNCYGNITIEIDSSGSCDVTGSSSQDLCPFGGPHTMPIVTLR